MNYIELQEHYGQLGDIALLSSIPLITLLEGGAQLIELAQGERFLTTTQTGSPCLCVVVSGGVSQMLNETSLSPSNRAGDIRYYQPGDVVGVGDFFAAKPSGLHAQAEQFSIILVLDAALFFVISGSNQQFCSEFLNARYTRVQVFDQTDSLKRINSNATPSNVIDGLYGSEWLDERLPDLFIQSKAVGSEINLLALKLAVIGDESNIDTTGVLAAVSTVLNTALRPNDVSIYFANDVVLTVLTGTDAQAAKVVVKRLTDRIARIVVFADMRFPLPHIQATVALESSSQASELGDFIASFSSKVNSLRTI